MKIFETIIRTIGLTGDVLVSFSFMVTCYQTTKILITGGQCSQVRMVNFDK